EEIAKIDEPEDTESDEGDDEATESDRKSEDEETREHEEESFDPISRTPEDNEDDNNDEEDQGLRLSEEERMQEEEEADELYRDVNINQGRGLQVSQNIENSHVTLTPVHPDGLQESSSVSSFVTSMLNPTSDAGVESIFMTASSLIVSLQTPTPIMTPSTIATITTSSDAPIPPTIIPSIILENLPTFDSVFRFDERLKSLETTFSEYRQTNSFVDVTDRLQDSFQRENDEFLCNIDENMKKIIKGQVKSQVKEQVLRILPRIEESVNATLEAEVLTRSSHSSRTSYAIAADLSEIELKKILIEKMEGNKREDDDQEGPSARSDQGSKRRREGAEHASVSTPSETATESAGRFTTGGTYADYLSDGKEEGTRQEEEESFDPIPRTPEGSEDEGNDKEDQDLRLSEEARIQEEEEADELYRDVDINQGRGLQVSQNIKDSHVTLTLVHPDGLQESSSVSSFVTSMLNPSNDAGVESIFTTASSPIAEVLTRSSHSSRTSYAVAADLSEMELKKILIEKMEGNKSIQRSDEQRNLYKVLVKAYDADKTILDTYGESTILKRRREDDDQEGPSAGSDRGSKRRREGGEHASSSTPSETATGSAEDQPIVQTSQHPELFSQPRRPPTLDRDWNKTLPAAQGNAQSWIRELASVDTLTPELLAGPTFELMRGSCNSLTEIEYHLKEVYKVTTDQLDWVNPEGQQYPHNMLQPLPLISSNK
nr:hypothetical protein [Tanacetum cinerariifolium]